MLGPFSAFIENLVKEMIETCLNLPSTPLFKLKKKLKGLSLVDLLFQIHQVGCCLVMFVLTSNNKLPTVVCSLGCVSKFSFVFFPFFSPFLGLQTDGVSNSSMKITSVQC